MRPSRGTLLAALLAFVLFVPGMWWGLPFIDGRDVERGWAIDDETPLGALAEAQHVIVRNSGAERNYGYPLFYYFASVGAYLPYLGYLAATDQFTKPTEAFPHGLANATHALRVMALLSKALTLLFAAAVVCGAYHAARLMWNARAGALAAVLVALMYPLAYYARTGNVDVPMLGSAAVGLAAFAAIARNGITPRRGVLLGVAAGLAVATKDSAGGLFAAVPLVMFAMPRPEGPSFPWKDWIGVALAALLALGIGSGFILDPQRYVQHLLFLAGRVEEIPGARTISLAIPMTMSGHLTALVFQLKGAASVLTLPGILLAIGGLAWFLPRDKAARLLFLPALTYSVFVFFFLRVEALRYLLPLTFILALFAGAAVDRLLGSPVRWRVAAGAGLFGAAALIGALRYADLTHAMLRDSRYDAAEWIATRLKAGDRLEYFGASQKLPRIPAGVTMARATEYHGMHSAHDTSETRAAAIVNEWMTRRPTMIIVIPDHSSLWRGAPFDGTMPPTLFSALESNSLPWRQLAWFETPPLFPWIRRPPLDYPMVNPRVAIYGNMAEKN